MASRWQKGSEPTYPVRRRGDVGPIERLKLCGGFSFIEVMIVVVILAILATLLDPRVMGRTEDEAGCRQGADSNIESALQLYKPDNGNFPSTEQGLKALVEKPAVAPPRRIEGGRIPAQGAG